jgi:oxepin-CoA hydrolase/3-oxo-5,6-dehydrosuberyl-CoA semialdehyde dehydrogenase
MPKLGNYVAGNWITGEGEGQPLFNAVNGEIITYASTKGLDFASMLDYGNRQSPLT